MGEEMLYDATAMNNALSALGAANSKLVVANSDYSSSTLDGKKFIDDAETIIEEVSAALRNAENALAGMSADIAGSFLTFDFSSEEGGIAYIDISGDFIIFNGDGVDKTAVEAMQRKLFRLGYFEGSKYKTEDEAADGEWGSNTRNALMQFLRNNKLDRNIDNGLSTSAFVDLMRCEETRTEAKARIKAENRILLKENVSGISDGDLEKILDMDDPELWDCVDALLSNNIPGATPEQEKRFNGAVILCLASNNVYSKGDRLVGYNTVVDHFNNGGNTPFDFDKKLGFDCSSFASTIAMIAYNFDKPQDTSTFNKDNRYTRKSYSEISIESLEKGDMILGLGDNHIVVYVGNGIVVHSHKSHGSEISANSLYGDSNYNTQIFLKTGYFNELVVLKPNIGTNG